MKNIKKGEKLNFLGIGSAFNTCKGNNSAYYIKDNKVTLIDCGGTTFKKIIESNILKDIDEIDVIITHTHPDHIGSLGDLIAYSYFILNLKSKIYFPNVKLIKEYLYSIGIVEELYIISGKIENESYRFIRSNHVDNIPAYSLVLKIEEDLIYYSGDSNDINSEIIEDFKEGKISYLYQDTSGLEYNGNPHMSINKLSKVFESKYRNRIFCMHLDNHIDEDEIKELGFNCVKEL